MTGTELHDLFITAIKRLNPDNENVRAFRAAFSFRQQYGDSSESEPTGIPSLACALERAFSLYTGADRKNSTYLLLEQVDRNFIENLAAAAATVPESVYDELLERLERHKCVPITIDMADIELACALSEYARLIDESLAPGP